MNDALLINLVMKCMALVLMLSLPIIGIAAMVGLMVGLFQSVTQIQDQTFAFAIKIVAVILTIVIFFKWSSGQLLQYATNILNQLPTFLR